MTGSLILWQQDGIHTKHPEAVCHLPTGSLLHNTLRTVQNSSTRTKYLHRKS